MSRFTRREYNAITWYADNHSYTMTLSVRPWVSYVKPQGEPVRVRLSEVVNEYNSHQKHQTRGRHRR